MAMMAASRSLQAGGLPELRREKFPVWRCGGAYGIGIRGQDEGNAEEAGQQLTGATARRDLIAVAVATMLFAALSIQFELSEAVFAWTRARERFQIDELPGTLLVLALGLAWFSWRRVGEVRAELERRREVELKLTVALADNRRLARDNVRIQEEERRLLARELHDELGQCLNAIKVDAVCIRQGTPETAPEVRAGAASIIEVAARMQATVGDLLRRLRPPGLDEFGLAAALEECVDAWRRRMPAVQFVFEMPGELPDWGEAVNITLYRLVQEGLTNVAKHARASEVRLRVAQEPAAAGADAAAAIVLQLSDDGVGAAPPLRTWGHGLVGMRERVEGLGGQFEASGMPGKGFRLVATLPASTAAL